METKTVYAYAADGKYVGERTLDSTDRSPISGAWQIPGNMTETQPPAAKEGCDRYYRSGKWEQVERPSLAPEPLPPTETEEARTVDGGTTDNELDMAEALLEMAAWLERQGKPLAEQKAEGG